MPEKIPTEAQEQAEFISWFKKNHPNILIFSHIDGAMLGGKNKFGLIASLKKQGWISGIPDIQIPQYNLWIEMKRQKGGKISDNQKAVIEKLESIGQTVLVCHGAEHAKQDTIRFMDYYAQTS